MPFDLAIKPTDRVAIMGMTGSGKTYFEGAILAGVPRLIVIDPKGLIRNDPMWPLDYQEDGWTKLDKGKPARMYVPPQSADEDYEVIFDRILQLRGIIVYIDELYGVGPARGSRGLRNLYTRGRQLGIGVHASFQRPVFVPLYALSEAEWKIMFHLEMEGDRDHMSAMGFGNYAYQWLDKDRHACMVKAPNGKITILPNGITVQVRGQAVEVA